jgi:hypothetical protein
MVPPGGLDLYPAGPCLAACHFFIVSAPLLLENVRLIAVELDFLVFGERWLDTASLLPGPEQPLELARRR